MNFVDTMKIHGLSASAAVRGQRLLTIKRMDTPALLSKTCRICVGRKIAEPRPATWHYRPLIDTASVIVACDEHTASAVRVYITVMGVSWQSPHAEQHATRTTKEQP